MLAGGPGCKVTTSTTTSRRSSTTKTSNMIWLKIGTNATAYYNSKTYNNLPVYFSVANPLDINQLFDYYGVVVGCYQPNGHQSQAGRGAVCVSTLYMPQSVTQTDTGKVNTQSIAQYIQSQAGLGGSTLQGFNPNLVQVTEAAGALGLFGGGNQQLTCREGHPGLPSISEAQQDTGYVLQYCVSVRSTSYFGTVTSRQQEVCKGLGLPAQCTLYVGVSPVPLTAQIVNISYLVPIPGLGGSGGTLLETNSVVGIDTANVLAFPYFTYNATIPSTYSQFTPATYLNISYDMYSPNNYADNIIAFGGPTTPVEPFNLFSGSGLLANYSSESRPSELAAFPYSVNSASSNTFYDEFPLVVGGTSAQTKTPIPLGKPTSSVPIPLGPLAGSPPLPTTVFQSNNAVNDSNLANVLSASYPPDSLTILAGTQLSANDVPPCSDDMSGGACMGDLNITNSTTLGSDLFVFGNITIDNGTTITTNGHAVITSGVVSDPTAIVSQGAGGATITKSNLPSALKANYTANSITYVNAQITGVSAPCSNQMLSGMCIGNTTFTSSASLTGNLFVFGNIKVNPGVIIQTNNHAIVTNGIITNLAGIIASYATGTTGSTLNYTSNTFTDANTNLFLGAQSLLNAPYPPNTIVYVSSTLDSASGLPACQDDPAGGSCIGDANVPDSYSLSSNLFIFGNLNMSGGTIATEGYSIITNGVISDPSSIIAGYKTGSISSGSHGSLGFTNITNPAFIVESPNGFVYVINYSKTSCFLCFTTTTNAILFKLKYLPTGYYNYSVYQPSQFATQTKPGNWNNQSANYFRGSLLVHTPSLYIVGATKFTTTKTPNYCLFGICLGTSTASGSTAAPFIPLAAGADYQGDLFMVGAHIPSSAYYPGSKSFAITEITGNGKVIVDNGISQADGFVPSQEFAVSPGGGFVYLANSSYPGDKHL